MSCTCHRSPTNDPSPLFYHKIAGTYKAVYAVLHAKQPVTIPYWDSNLSAYNDSPPAGCVQLQTSTTALPVSAKYTIAQIMQDVADGTEKDLKDYGIVLNLEGKIIKYDPDLMNVKINTLPVRDFVAKYKSGDFNKRITYTTINKPDLQINWLPWLIAGAALLILK